MLPRDFVAAPHWETRNNHSEPRDYVGQGSGVAVTVGVVNTLSLKQQKANRNRAASA